MATSSKPPNQPLAEIPTLELPEPGQISAQRQAYCRNCGRYLGIYLPDHPNICSPCRVSVQEHLHHDQIVAALDHLPKSLRGLRFGSAELRHRLQNKHGQLPSHLRNVYATLYKWDPLKQPGILLTAPPKAGTTSLAAACFLALGDRALYSQDQAHFKLAANPWFLKVSKLERAINPNVQRHPPNQLRQAYGASWLVLDGLGEETEPPTPYWKRTLNELLHHRRQRSAPCLITTHLSWSEMVHRYGDWLNRHLHAWFQTLVIAPPEHDDTLNLKFELPKEG
jgi:hypothetical protein